MKIEDAARGNDADHAFGTAEHGWDGFWVVDFHGVEEIARPFRYVITLARPGEMEPLDLEKMLDAPASLAVRHIGGGAFTLRHGVIAEVVEVERTETVAVYQVMLVPHLERAAHRVHCRTFVDRTLADVLSSVLRNASVDRPEGPGGLSESSDGALLEDAPVLAESYEAPAASFRWELRDARSHDRLQTKGLREYVVQYAESDLDFVSRTLEEEGLSYFFEHGVGRVVMHITDAPAEVSLAPERRAVRRLGVGLTMVPFGEELVRSYQEARRTRPRSVTMRDYHWRRPDLPLEASRRAGAGPDGGGFSHFEFPARDEELLDDPCGHPASVKLERFEAERCLSDGAGNIRSLAAGERFTLTDAHGVTTLDLLTQRVVVEAVQHEMPGTALDTMPFGESGRTARKAPFYETRFRALPASVAYRPPRATPKPRIHGVQTAIVTDHEGKAGPTPEIHCDDWARVRVRFPWDEREDEQPSSGWIRVSQIWAGAGFGGLFTPRVGQEVLVAHLQGDPDAPTVVGRVYNAKNPLPLNAGRTPEQSTIRTQSTPEAEGSNEIRFNDLAKAEQIYVHAQRDLDEVALRDHTTVIGNDQSNKVERDQENRVGKSRVHHVGEDETLTIGGKRKRDVGGDEEVTIGGDRKVAIGGALTTSVAGDEERTVDGEQTLSVGKSRSATIDQDDKLDVGGARNITVGGDRNLQVSGGQTIEVGADESVHVSGARTLVVDKDHGIEAGGELSSSAGKAHRFTSEDFAIEAKKAIKAECKTATVTCSDSFKLEVGSAVIEVGPGFVRIDNGAGASITLSGGSAVVHADGRTTVVGGMVDINP